MPTASAVLMPGVNHMEASLPGFEPMNGVAKPGRDVLIVDVCDVTKSM